MSAGTYRRIEGLFWIGIGLLICYLAWRAHLGTFMEPGPGFMPFVVGLFISAVSLIMLLTQIFSRGSRQDTFDFRQVLRSVPKSRLGFTVAILVCYALFLGKLGYIVATFLLMWGLLYDWRKKNWVKSFLSSLAIVMGSYLLFEVWLRSQLPRGVLPWW
jgi:putative tricarboxylic transport membrane protein